MANSLAVKVQCVSNLEEISVSAPCNLRSRHSVYSVSFCEMNGTERRDGFVVGGCKFWGLSSSPAVYPIFQVLNQHSDILRISRI